PQRCNSSSRRWSDGGRRNKRNVINSWDSCAADLEVYESCSERDLRRLAQDKCPDFSSGNNLNAPIESGCIHGMDGNNREMIRWAYWRSGVSLGVTIHVCDRATKHERQG